MFPIIEVPADAADSFEAMGTKRKFWFRQEDGLWLFKLTRAGTGEDWAETIVAELCTLLGLPCAHYELASWRDQPGVVSPSFVGAGERLIPGNELLFEMDPAYPKQASSAKTRVSRHTLDAVASVLDNDTIHIPVSTGGDLPAEVRTAWDVFAGYVLLDACIGNTDRHHENWALIESAAAGAPERRLAPTHDHGSSLGRNESDPNPSRRLQTRDGNDTVDAYAARAASKLYRHPDDTRPLATFQAFEQAARMMGTAAHAWLRRLAQIDILAADAFFEHVPPDRLSPPAKRFAQRILRFNWDRLVRLLEGTP